MAKFAIDEVIMYYDGIQLAIVSERDSFEYPDEDRKFLAVQTIDDNTYLATRISLGQEQDFKADRVDVKTLMSNPYLDDIYILIQPEMGSDYIKLNTYYEFYGFSVDQFNLAFLDWGIPDPDLYYSDH